MENPKDETQKDDLTPPAKDEDPQEHAKEDPKPVPPAAAPKKPKTGEGEEDSYEDGWYQVLKRRAVGSGDHEE
jgi:hypothetical protein